MSGWKWLGTIGLLMMLAACTSPAYPTATDTPAATVAIAPSPTAQPTTPPAPSPQAIPLLLDEPGAVALDFVAQACQARWTTNAGPVPCPGTEVAPGYLAADRVALAEGRLVVEAPLLVAFPGREYPLGMGLFGTYAPYTVQQGDTFHAVIGCLSQSPCAATFALAYYDAQGHYLEPALWQWEHHSGDGMRTVALDLSTLAGSTVRWTLVMQVPDPAPEENLLLWVQPRIEHAVSPTPDARHGVVRGRVDFTAAPPFLHDPVLGNASVIVVFHSLDDGHVAWTQTLRADGAFEIRLTPGRYQVLAYASGIPDLPVVRAGMACGPLPTVQVTASTLSADLVLHTWDTTCPAATDWPLLPPGVPLP